MKTFRFIIMLICLAVTIALFCMAYGDLVKYGLMHWSADLLVMAFMLFLGFKALQTSDKILNEK